MSNNKKAANQQTNANLTPEQKAFMEQYQQKETRKGKRASKRQEKLDMYDMILANLLVRKILRRVGS